MKNLIKKILRLLPDELYIQLQYFHHFHRFANLKNPQTFNEKLNWLKLHDRNPLYTTLVDKYAVKKWVADKIGEQYIIPTLDVWERAEDIDFDKLPNQFVLKCNHSGGGNVIICRDKAKLNKQASIKKLSSQLKNNNYWYGREWPYKNVKPRIIAEKYMVDQTTKELRDYKFFCCDGSVDNVMVCLDRASGDTKFYFFNNKWELLRINKRGKAAPKNFTLSKPAPMDKMFELAANLSKGIPFVRVDLYCCEEQIYFGEMTFYPQSGFDVNLLSATDLYLGKLIHLPKNIRSIS